VPRRPMASSDISARGGWPRRVMPAYGLAGGPGAGRGRVPPTAAGLSPIAPPAARAPLDSHSGGVRPHAKKDPALWGGAESCVGENLSPRRWQQ
jgi:hypothetical protein